MNGAALYLVFDPERSYGSRWLKLDDGPAKYGRWVSSSTDATPMTFAKANDFANAYAKNSSTVMVVGIDRRGEEDELMREYNAARGIREASSAPWGYCG